MKAAAWLVIFALLGLLPHGVASAQSSYPASGCDAATLKCADQGAAYAAAAGNNAHLEACSYGGNERIAARGTPVSGYVKERECLTSSGGSYGWQQPLTSDNPTWGFDPAKTCSTRPDNHDWMTGGDAPNLVCSEGCTYESAVDLDTGESWYTPTGNTCTADDVPEPLTDTDGDGVADPDDAFPSDPNESADTDGDGIGDNADFSPDDPDDGADDPGEEDGDDEGDNVASGGGDCQAPPTCSGDGIQCAQLYQQWKIRCSGAVVTGSPEHCEASYSCTGDTAQCAQIALLRKTACQEQGADGVPGDSNGNGQPDWTEVPEPPREDPGADDDVTEFGIGINTDLLDQENIFGGGTCPAFSIEIMGFAASSSDIPAWCDIVAIMRAVILIVGAFTALRILMGSTD